MRAPTWINQGQLQESTDELQHLERTPDYMISTWRSVMFLAWRGRETAEGILRSRSLMEPWAARKQGGVVLVILMPPSSNLKQPPNEDARKAMVDASQDTSQAFKGIAIISDEAGFIGSMIRSVMTARQIFARTPVPFKMFTSAAEAASWISQRLELRTDMQLAFSAAADKAIWK